MKNDTITKNDLDSVVKKLSDSILTGFEEARKDRGIIKTDLSSLSKRFDSLEKDLGSMKENMFEFIEDVQSRFDEAQKDRDQIKKQIRDIMLFEVGKLKKDVKMLDDRLSFIENALAIPK